MKKITLTALVVLLLTACTQKTTQITPYTSTPSTPLPTEPASATPPTIVKTPLVFKLTSQNNSKQDGTATLEEVDGKVKVTLSLDNGVITPEPAHIHVGSCPSPGDVRYTLTNVVNGKSETTLSGNVNMDALRDIGELAINVHKSASDLKTYVSCGNLDWKSAATGSPSVSPR